VNWHEGDRHIGVSHLSAWHNQLDLRCSCLLWECSQVSSHTWSPLPLYSSVCGHFCLWASTGCLPKFHPVSVILCIHQYVYLIFLNFSCISLIYVGLYMTIKRKEAIFRRSECIYICVYINLIKQRSFHFKFVH
jgi:hypothetical protein